MARGRCLKVFPYLCVGLILDFMNDFVVSPNITLRADAGFGRFDAEVVGGLLRAVDEGFAEAMGAHPLASRPCFVMYNNVRPVPMCMTDGAVHYILLTCRGNYWCQWVYQFAHEYCHHLVDGPMTGEVCGMKWFEESLCHLASMYHLSRIGRQWERLPFVRESHRHYGQAVRYYLHDLVQASLNLSWEGKYTFDRVQADREHNRDTYDAVAVRMLPYFQTCPALWRMLSHLGDTRRWGSREALWIHLLSVATPEWRNAFQKMIHGF